MEITASWISNAFYYNNKRLWDILIAGALLFVCLPLFIIIPVLIVLDSRGPAIFKQTRVGCKVRCHKGLVSKEITTFNFYKFRSMTHKADDRCHRDFIQAYINNDENKMHELQHGPVEANHTFKLNNDSRVTRVGAFLRKTSLDEIPQFWNVLKGDMSMVGPRPPIPYEVEMYKPWHHERLYATPGITGLWQVASRNSGNFEEMVRLDIDYIQRQSLLLDLKIILKTPFAVLLKRGC